MNGNASVFFSIQNLNDEMTLSVMPVTVFIGIEAVIGFVGNVLIILVYSRHYETSNFRYFVLSMAVIDLTSCFTTLPGEMFSQMNWYTYQYTWICKVKSYFNVFTAWGSASILLLLGFDRYRKICRPLQWQIQPAMARRLCILSFVLSSLMAVPILMLWGTQSYLYQYEGVVLNVSICEKSETYANDIYPLIYIGSVYVIPLGIMVCVVSTLNVLTARKLFGRQRPFLKNHTFNTKSPSTTTLTKAMVSDTSSLDAMDIRKVSVSSISVISCCGNISNGTEDVNQDNAGNLHQTIDQSDQNQTSECSVKQTLHTTLTLLRPGDNIVNPPKRANTYPCHKNANSASSLSPLFLSLKRKFDASFSEKNIPNKDKKGDAVRQKTIIMLVLTIMFVVTMTMYVVLTSMVAATEGVLKNLSNSEKAAYFFFWRLYFVNTNINPLLYGYMDPRFRTGLQSIFK